MAVVGLGTDLARSSRFRRLLDAGKNGVIERLFSLDERAYCLRQKDPSPHLAARFAAKEAFLKALGLGLRDGLSWQDMEVVRGPLGQPQLKFRGRAAELIAERQISAVHLSYSHDGDYAVANVILETS
ncbi:holo-[acyl-carrier-protein] synthase [Desulfuromonas carbonis]|uniref:holo-ACP synthase n=1 Tax=Desulfuromonas sp. DDH964 TaxID=1823759 RepID=UPI00078BF84D|nr:4'-phosphopantetheinyl transferase [Desulfuromonas sp. DDH964]